MPQQEGSDSQRCRQVNVVQDAGPGGMGTMLWWTTCKLWISLCTQVIRAAGGSAVVTAGGPAKRHLLRRSGRLGNGELNVWHSALTEQAKKS